MYKITICDDDPSYVEELKECILNCDKNERELAIDVFYSGESLLQSMDENSDVVFLDIQMQDIDGNQVAVELNNKGYQGLLVQFSGIFMPTPETIKISPFRYLLKQSTQNELEKEIKEILEEMDRRKECCVLEASYCREKIIIRTVDIVYITHHKKGSILHLCKGKRERYEEGKILVPYNFKVLLEMLKNNGFAMPHNSYLVNMAYIEDCCFNKGLFAMEGRNFMISRSRVSDFAQQFTLFLSEKYRGSRR